MNALRDKETRMRLKLINLQKELMLGDLYELIKETAWEPEVSCSLNVWNNDYEDYYSQVKMVSGQFFVEVASYNDTCDDCFVIAGDTDRDIAFSWDLPLKEVDVEFLEFAFMEVLNQE